MYRKLTTSLVLLLALAGCSTSMSSRDYAVLRESMASDPQARREAVRNCTQRFAGKSLEYRRNLARIARTSVARGPSVVCQRFYRGIANGRLTYADFQSDSSTKWIAVISGR